MDIKRNVVLVVLVGLTFFTGGCSLMDKAYVGVVGMTDPDSVTLKTDFKWMHPQPNIRPANVAAPKVYLRVRNTSGSDIDIAHEIRQQMLAAGFELTRDITQASYYVNADLRYFGETATKQHKAVLASTIVGAGVGAGIGAATGSDNTLLGAGIGAAAGLGMGEVMANRNKIRQISLIVDVTLGERVAGGVTTSRSTDDRQRTTSSAAANTGGGYEGGSSAANTRESQSVQLKEDFLYHKNRAVVESSKMNLTLDEARPVVVSRLSRAIGSILP